MYGRREKSLPQIYPGFINGGLGKVGGVRGAGWQMLRCVRGSDYFTYP